MAEERSMREERGKFRGNLVIDDAVDFWGAVNGNMKVVAGGKLYMRGAIYGNLTVEDGGRVHVFGHVTGDLLVMAGAKVIHSGTIGGDAINRGGRLYVEAGAVVMGKVKTRDGETRIHSKAKVNP